MTAFLAAAVALAAAAPPSVAVPMTKVGTAAVWSVVMTVDGHELRMQVDPKAPRTIIGAPAARRIGLHTNGAAGPAVRDRLGPPVVLRVVASESTVCRYTLGGYAGGLVDVYVADLTGPGVEPDGTDGVLGADLLTTHACRVGPPDGVLHVHPLPTPAGGRLAGHWACTGVDTVIGPGDAARAAAVSFDFDGDQARFRSRTMDERHYFNVYESGTPAGLVMYQNGPTLNGTRSVITRPSVYRLSGDTLTVLCTDAGGSVEWNELPKDFKPAKNLVVMHFKRVGPAVPFPAAPKAVALPPAAVPRRGN